MKIRKVRGANRSENTVKKKSRSLSIKRKEPNIELKRKENRYNFRDPKNKQKVRSTKKNVIKRKSAAKSKKANKIVFKGPSRLIKIAIIVILAIIYIPTIVVWFTGKDLKLDYLKNGTIKEIIDAEGIFIRNEEILVSPETGKCITSIYLGEKVGKNQDIGKIINNSSEKSIKELNYINGKILKIIKAESENANFYSEDILKIDEEINSKLKEISLMSVKNNIESSEKYESEINELIKKKINLVSDSNVIGSVKLENYKQIKKKLVAESDKNTYKLKAKNSGLVAYFIDGYENQYTPGNMYNISIEDINSVKKITNDSFDFSSFNVERRKPYAKLIKDFESYIAFALDSKSAKLLKKGDNISMVIQDINKSTNAKVIKKINEGSKTKVFLKITSLLSETCTLRKAEFEIIIRPYNGLKVPVKSLIDFDKQRKKAKIMLVKSNYSELKNVSIVVYNNEYAIIDNVKNEVNRAISIYDKYVIDPKGVSEGEKLKDGD